jgi:hypothetical protein
VVHAFGEGHQRIAQRGLADVAHDPRGDLLIGFVVPGSVQIGF